MPDRGTLSNDKIKKLINFESSWALEKGYRQYIEWYLNLFEGKKKKLKKNLEIDMFIEDVWLSKVLEFSSL